MKTNSLSDRQTHQPTLILFPDHLTGNWRTDWEVYEKLHPLPPQSMGQFHS